MAFIRCGAASGADLTALAIIGSNANVNNALTIAANSANGADILVEYTHNTQTANAPTVTCTNGTVSNKQNHHAIFTGAVTQSIGSFVISGYDKTQSITITLTDISSNPGGGSYCNVIALN